MGRSQLAVGRRAGDADAGHAWNVRIADEHAVHFLQEVRACFGEASEPLLIRACLLVFVRESEPYCANLKKKR